jgi:multiple sugar transport system ATP-binding protein
MVHVNGKEVVCRVHPMHARERGERMDLMFDMAKAVYFDPQTEQRLA